MFVCRHLVGFCIAFGLLLAADLEAKELKTLGDVHSALTQAADSFTHRYRLDYSDRCLRIVDHQDHIWILTQDELMLGYQHKWQTQKRAQLGFYAPWIQVIDALLHQKKLMLHRCSTKKHIRHCRIPLTSQEYLSIYQDVRYPHRWITAFYLHQQKLIMRFEINGEAYDADTPCTPGDNLYVRYSQTSKR